MRILAIGVRSVRRERERRLSGDGFRMPASSATASGKTTQGRALKPESALRGLKTVVTIRPVTSADAGQWLTMRQALWPGGGESEHRQEIEAFLSGKITEPEAVLVAEDGAARLVGFLELSKRWHAEGCTTRPVAYLEGWYVGPEARGRGIGRALVAAAEGWGREQGCREFASDAEAENETSRSAHLALGFEDVGLVRCFRKRL